MHFYERLGYERLEAPLSVSDASSREPSFELVPLPARLTVSVEPTEAEARPFTPSLFVQASVVSTVHDSHAVIDAGLKSFATDGPEPELHAGAPAGVSRTRQ